MSITASELLCQGKTEELWQKCCGFLHLSTDEFMQIQERLLMQQIELLAGCPLGKRLMKGRKPESVEEFRRTIPLTTYRDYLPELAEKNIEALPAKPEFWIHSSGWSDEYSYKWIPATKDYAEILSTLAYAVGILSSCNQQGDVSNIPERPNILYSVAPQPYMSGTFAHLLERQCPVNYFPSISEVNTMTFEERIKKGLEQALEQGFDYFFGLSFVLASIGDKFVNTKNNVNVTKYINKPRQLARLARAYLSCKLKKRPMYPRDIWSLKGIIGSGVDSSIYKEKVKKYWGRTPLDIYSCSEGGIIATQAWDYQDMTFIPNLNFLEFIPEDEQLKHEMDSSYIPKTCLLNEVEPDTNYEIVLTNFHGGCLLRYRVGDMIRITSLENRKTGIGTPQMSFERRVDSHIDFYFVRLTERKIWEAIEAVKIPYQDWFAFKEPGSQNLNIYLELQHSVSCNAKDLAGRIREQIMDIALLNQTTDENLADMTEFSVDVKFLPRGTFQQYLLRKQREGADLAHLKPPHLNPSDEIVELLLKEQIDSIEKEVFA